MIIGQCRPDRHSREYGTWFECAAVNLCLESFPHVPTVLVLGERYSGQYICADLIGAEKNVRLMLSTPFSAGELQWLLSLTNREDQFRMEWDITDMLTSSVVLCAGWLHQLRLGEPQKLLARLIESSGNLIVCDTTEMMVNQVINSELWLYGYSSPDHFDLRDATKTVGFYGRNDIEALFTGLRSPDHFQYMDICSQCGFVVCEHQNSNYWIAVWKKEGGV